MTIHIDTLEQIPGYGMNFKCATPETAILPLSIFLTYLAYKKFLFPRLNQKGKMYTKRLTYISVFYGLFLSLHCHPWSTAMGEGIGIRISPNSVLHVGSFLYKTSIGLSFVTLILAPIGNLITLLILKRKDKLITTKQYIYSMVLWFVGIFIALWFFHFEYYF